MQINRISYTNYTPNYNKPKKQQNFYQTTNNLNFEGLNFKKFAPLFQTKSEKLYIENFIIDTSNFLRVNSETIEKFVTPKAKNKMKFFRELATKARNEYFSKINLVQEDRFNDIENLYKSVKKPTNTHISIVKNSDFSFDESAELLKLVEEKPENLPLYQKITGLKNLSGYHLELPAKTLMAILSSENSPKLNKHFDDFSSYIILNHNNENFLEELSTKLSSEILPLDVKKTNKILDIERRKANSFFLPIINNKDLIECDNELGMKLFYNKRGTAPYLRKGTKELSKEDLDFYKYVISTTNKTNFDARSTFFKTRCINALDENGNTRDDIKRLFQKMDDDKYTRKIFESISSYGYGIAKEPIDKLLYYIDSFGSKQVYKNLENFIQITTSKLDTGSKPEEIVEIISKDLNNKFYRTPAMENRLADKELMASLQPLFPKTKIAILKLKNKIKYSIMPKIFGTGKPATINHNATYRKPAPKILEPEVLAPTNLIPAKPTIKKSINHKKLQIQKEAQEIIKSRMKSTKQIEEQIGDYTKNPQK